MDILDEMRVSKLSAKVFFLKVNYSFKVLFNNTDARFHRQHLKAH